MLQILLSSKNRLCPEGHPQNKESQFPEASFHSRLVKLVQLVLGGAAQEGGVFHLVHHHLARRQHLQWLHLQIHLCSQLSSSSGNLLIEFVVDSQMLIGLT